jgi:hypothetical protein
VVSRYEAGRDGCGLQRTPRSSAADDAAVVSSSIEVSRRLYRATTDRIDGKKSLDVSAHYRAGDGGSRSVVQVSQRTDRGSIPPASHPDFSSIGFCTRFRTAPPAARCGSSDDTVDALYVALTGLYRDDILRFAKCCNATSSDMITAKPIAFLPPARMRGRATGRLAAGVLTLMAVCADLHAAAVHPGAFRAEFDQLAADGDDAAQLHCLALNVYHEARGEPEAGKFAVAVVTLNRVRSSRFPHTVCRVVWQRGQFSWTHDGKPDKPYNPQAWSLALWIAKIVSSYDTFSPADRATHFHAEYVLPYWARGRNPVGRVGRHLFYAHP